MLHGKQQRYLRLTQCRELLREVDSLFNTSPEDNPVESQYLLELNYSTSYNASFKCQAYWTLAMKAACRAGQCAAVSHKWKGGAKRCRAAHSRQKKAMV
jgi:hypothetical protein